MRTTMSNSGTIVFRGRAMDGQRLRYFTENQEVAIADDFDSQVIQFGVGQLFLDFVRRKRGQQAVVEVPPQDRRLIGRVLPDESFRPGASGGSEKVGHENARSRFRVASNAVPEQHRVVE